MFIVTGYCAAEVLQGESIWLRVLAITPSLDGCMRDVSTSVTSMSQSSDLGRQGRGFGF